MQPLETRSSCTILQRDKNREAQVQESMCVAIPDLCGGGQRRGQQVSLSEVTYRRISRTYNQIVWVYTGRRPQFNLKPFADHSSSWLFALMYTVTEMQLNHSSTCNDVTVCIFLRERRFRYCHTGNCWGECERLELSIPGTAHHITSLYKL
jgi:hypothetical protein